MRAAILALFAVLPALFASAPRADEAAGGWRAPDERAAWLELARRGWGYELRKTMFRRDVAVAVRIHGRDFAGAALCIVGERPHAHSAATIAAFAALLSRAYGKPLPTRYAGAEATGCGQGRIVMLRLYSGQPPNQAMSRDLDWMNEAYDLGLPRGRYYAAGSPALGQTFFGKRGRAAHIMVMQPVFARLDPVEAAYFKSILIEELFQSFTYGMDVLHFDRKEAFRSKLQEIPERRDRWSWSSRGFMASLLRSNPAALCPFDVFMMHAVGLAPTAETTDPAFIDFIETDYDRLAALTAATLADPAVATIVDPGCRGR